MIICLSKSERRVQGSVSSPADLAQFIRSADLGWPVSLFVWGADDWVPVSRNGGMTVMAILRDPGAALPLYCTQLYEAAGASRDRDRWLATQLEEIVRWASQRD